MAGSQNQEDLIEEQVRVISYWNKLRREGEDFPCLDIFNNQSHVDKINNQTNIYGSSTKGNSVKVSALWSAEDCSI